MQFPQRFSGIRFTSRGRNFIDVIDKSLNCCKIQGRPANHNTIKTEKLLNVPANMNLQKIKQTLVALILKIQSLMLAIR